VEEKKRSESPPAKNGKQAPAQHKPVETVAEPRQEEARPRHQVFTREEAGSDEELDAVSAAILMSSRLKKRSSKRSRRRERPSAASSAETHASVSTSSSLTTRRSIG
jgi:hypothetical protein